jgi:methyl-accepting chemotaxis protein
LSQVAAQIATGSVEQRVEIKSPDELGDMAAAFQGMVVYLQEVGDIVVAAQQMDALANGLASAMDTVSAVVEENTSATLAVPQAVSHAAARVLPGGDGRQTPPLRRKT